MHDPALLIRSPELTYSAKKFEYNSRESRPSARHKDVHDHPVGNPDLPLARSRGLLPCIRSGTRDEFDSETHSVP